MRTTLAARAIFSWYERSIKNKDIALLQQAVLRWYASHGRHDLPWRNLTKLGVAVPYGVLVSEFMLQQTQVERVIPKFNAFIQYFPTIQKLARSESAKVVVLWSGLGYNRRAVQLWQTAQKIVTEHGATVPTDITILARLPGVGAYTAAAVASFGYNQPVVVWDTNIQRFFELLIWGYDVPPLLEAKRVAQSFIPTGHSADWHAGLMDLMTLIRKEKSPKNQQAKLLIALDSTPQWELPILTAAPLKRTRQSSYLGSKRYYRALVVEFLRRQKGHTSTFAQIGQHLEAHLLPKEYRVYDILVGLKKDKLIMFYGPLRPDTLIKL